MKILVGKTAAVAMVMVMSVGLIGCGSTRSVASFCKLSNDLSSNSFASLGASSSKADVKKAVDQLVSQVHKAKDAAPSAIKTDVATISGAVDKIAAELKTDGYDVTKAFSSPAFQKLGTDAALTKASTNVDTYTAKNCKSTTTT